jgi:hypothetical protein
MIKNETEEDKPEDKDLSIPAQIASFASKLGDEVGTKFRCYVYRVVKDPESGRTKRPFVKKYDGVEPDPCEIAEQFRAGTYSMQFVWKPRSKSDTGNKAFTLDVDENAFPPISKNTAITPYGNTGGNMSEAMTIQLTMMHEISEVMKSAYQSGGNNLSRVGPNNDPMEMFTGLFEQMESGFTRAMAIQTKIMERVMQKKMENSYGLTDEVSPAPQLAGGDETIIGKYAPIVNEIVSGIKTVIGFFGENVPANVVKKVKENERFQDLLKDQKALVVIGQALRREFGDEKAQNLMNTFGVRMVIQRPPSAVSQTPIPAVARARKVESGKSPIKPVAPVVAPGKAVKGAVTK